MCHLTAHVYNLYENQIEKQTAKQNCLGFLMETESHTNKQAQSYFFFSLSLSLSLSQFPLCNLTPDRCSTCGLKQSAILKVFETKFVLCFKNSIV